jgi:hypothetical protein
MTKIHLFKRKKFKHPCNIEIESQAYPFNIVLILLQEARFFYPILHEK